jgi:methyl-accepting chemotaxis protein
VWIAHEGRVAELLVLPAGNKEGALVVVQPIEDAALRADVAPLGIDAAIVVGKVLASTLPPSMRPQIAALAASSEVTVRDLEESDLGYRVRVQPLDGARAVVAVSRAHVKGLTSDVAAFEAIVLVAVVLSSLLALGLVLSRSAAPLAELERSAAAVGRGRFDEALRALASCLVRKDELGVLARVLHHAASQLDQVSRAGGDALSAVERVIGGVRTAARDVDAGVARQRERMLELRRRLQALADGSLRARDELSELRSALERTLVELGELAGKGDASGAAARRMLGEGEIAQAVKAVEEQLLQVSRIVHISSIRALRDNQFTDASRRSIDEIDDLARRHAADAGKLETLATALRADVQRLSQALTVLVQTGRSRS